MDFGFEIMLARVFDEVQGLDQYIQAGLGIAAGTQDIGQQGKVIGEVKSAAPLVAPATAGFPKSDKTLIDGKEKGRRKGEPNQL